MYKLNDSVELDGVVGRIIAIENSSTYHVLIRIGANTWKVEKWYMFRPYVGYLWTIPEAFRAKGISYQPSPKIVPMDDSHVLRFK